MRVMSLGGSQWQLELIQTLTRLGYETVVADINPNCPGRLHSTHYVQIDTADKAAALAVAKKFAVDLVIAEQTDRFVPIAAYINQALHLPGILPEVATRFTDKLVMRDTLSGKVDMPAYEEVADVAGALRFAASVGYPVVLKPKCAQSSCGVSKVDDAETLTECFSEAMGHSGDGRVLVEGFISGPEITVEGLSIDGKFHPLAISEKCHYDFNPCVARRLSYPPRFSASRMAAIVDAAERVVSTLGLENGLSHAEYRMSGDTPYLIEVAARGGGNRIASRIVPHVCQFDVYRLLIERLGGKPVLVPPIANKAAVLNFLDFEPGRVTRIYGLDEVRDQALAAEVVLSFREGDEIVRPSNDTQRLGYAIVLGEDRDDVDARCERIQQLLRVDYAR